MDPTGALAIKTELSVQTEMSPPASGSATPTASTPSPGSFPPSLQIPATPNDHCTSSTTTPTFSNGPRRPPRKSTLTQQQKNQKRQRATQDQLTTLEVEFNKNPTPTALVRERIADEINMTERSVQIWFQNRRAKIKNLAKRSIETGEDCDAIPESMRKYLALQAMESGKPFIHADALRGVDGLAGLGAGLLMNAESNAHKVPISHLTCRSLQIGTWRRVGQTQLDLVVFYSPTKSMVTYYIQAEGSGFRIEYPFSSIKNITLDSGDPADDAEGANHHQRSGGLIVELNRPPIFTMDQGSGGWFQCRDFTEDQQASKVFTHHLGGHPKVLSGQLAKLVSLEPFRNRHTPMMHEGLAMPVPMPAAMANMVGPPRPASQPNQNDHSNVNNAAIKQDVGLNTGMGPPPPRGHKRQRSRSVPAALDFAQRRQPMTPFTFHQHHHIHLNSPGPSQQQQQQHIYAPIPQYAPSHLPQVHHPAGFAGPGVATPVNHDAGDCPCGFCPPPTASTTASPPSEFDSTPLTSSQYFDPMMAPSTTPFSGPFAPSLVDTSSLIHSSVSPISNLSHQDSMADKQHANAWLGRSASAEIAVVSPPPLSNDDVEAKWLQFVHENAAFGFDYNRQMGFAPDVGFPGAVNPFLNAKMQKVDHHHQQGFQQQTSYLQPHKAFEVPLSPHDTTPTHKISSPDQGSKSASSLTPTQVKTGEQSPDETALQRFSQEINLAFRAPLPDSPPKEEEFDFHHMINLSSFDDSAPSGTLSPEPEEVF